MRSALVVSLLPLRVLHTDAEAAEGTVFCLFIGISLLRIKNFWGVLGVASAPENFGLVFKVGVVGALIESGWIWEWICPPPPLLPQKMACSSVKKEICTQLTKFPCGGF